MKRIMFILMLVSLLIISACGKSDNTSPGNSESEVQVGEDLEGATEIEFWTFNEQHMDLYEDSANRWNEENPDKPIKLNAATYPINQMHNNLNLSLQSGKGAPDIVDIEIRYFANYLKGDIQFEKMNDHVEPVIDKMIKERFDIYGKDGDYYGIPYHVGATVMYYNQEIMDEAGVDIDSIKTWDDYVEVGKVVLEKTGKPMTTVETDEQFTYFPLVSQRESNYFDEKGNITLNNDTNIEVLEFLNKIIYEDEIAITTPGGKHHAEEYYGFMNDGGAATLMMPIWYMGRFIDYMPDLKGKMVVRPLPSWEDGGNRTAGIGGTGTVVPSQSEEADLAKEFLAFTKLTEEGNINLWEVMGFDPPRYDVWDSDAMQKDNRYYEYFHEGIFDMLYELRDEVAVINYTTDFPAAQDEIETHVLFSVLKENNEEAKEALDKAAKAVESKQYDED